jgi:hypothetical protein
MNADAVRKSVAIQAIASGDIAPDYQKLHGGQSAVIEQERSFKPGFSRRR